MSKINQNAELSPEEMYTLVSTFNVYPSLSRETPREIIALAVDLYNQLVDIREGQKITLDELKSSDRSAWNEARTNYIKSNRAEVERMTKLIEESFIAIFPHEYGISRNWAVKSPYNEQFISLCKAAGARWDSYSKTWVFTTVETAIGLVRQSFPDKVVWVLNKKP
jgi:hypothetical protein